MKQGAMAQHGALGLCFAMSWDGGLLCVGHARLKVLTWASSVSFGKNEAKAQFPPLLQLEFVSPALLGEAG